MGDFGRWSGGVNGSRCALRERCDGVGEQQVPRLRRRWRSGCARNDKRWVAYALRFLRRVSLPSRVVARSG